MIRALRLSTLAIFASASPVLAQTLNFAEYWPVAPGYSWKGVVPGCADACSCAQLDLWEVQGPDGVIPNALRVGPSFNSAFVLENSGASFKFHGFYDSGTYIPLTGGAASLGSIPDGFSFQAEPNIEVLVRDWNAISPVDQVRYPIANGAQDVVVFLWYHTGPGIDGVGNNHNTVFEAGLPPGTAPVGSITDVDWFMKGHGLLAYMDVEAIGPIPAKGSPWPPVLDLSWSASLDCNGNQLFDHFDISSGTSLDVNNNCIPDECEPGNSGNAYCFGDGSGIFCPCSSLGNTGEGCANTGGNGGALLVGTGDASFAGDTFKLSVSGVPGSKPGLILRGNNQVNVPAGDGILCAAGGSMRSQVQITSAGSTTFTLFKGRRLAPWRTWAGQRQTSSSGIATPPTPAAVRGSTSATGGR